MSPAPAVTRDRESDRSDSVAPFPTADVLAVMAKEIVVDWQLPSDVEQKN